MDQEAELIKNYFQKLGLEPEIADLYIALYHRGAQTISELSRSAGVERTRIYRLMDHLKQSGLVEVEVQYKRSIFRAAPIGNLRILVSRKEQELRGLQDELTAIEQTLARQSMSSASTRVQFYEGPDGLRQMYWNQSKARTEAVAILYENMQTRANAAFFDRWVRRMNERQVHTRGLIGDHFIRSQQTWYSKRQNERLQHWESRYLPESVYPITYGMVVYDDVVAYQNWRDDEAFGIEIYNQQIADGQRRLFELLWERARPVDDLKGLTAAE